MEVSGESPGVTPAPARSILFLEPEPPPRDAVERYFGSRRLPGTASIASRKTRPDLFQDTLDSPRVPYQEWLEKTVSESVEALLPGRCFTDRDESRLMRGVAEMLGQSVEEGLSLEASIPQQMVEDVFLRMVRFLVPEGKISDGRHPYEAFNALCHRVAVLLLHEMDRGGWIGDSFAAITRLIHLAVLSGYVGINLKSTASAASELLNRNLVPIHGEWVDGMVAVQSVPEEDLLMVARRLMALTRLPEGRFGLEFLSAYRREVVDARDPLLLVFLSDDYMESLIDMKRFEVMVLRNPNLKVLFVPRNGRYGNDLAVEDMAAILEEPVLEGFRDLVRQERIHISADGPRAGCLDPRDLSGQFIRDLDRLAQHRRVVLETKGCRNFEMLKGGLPIPWYASFNCNRALSIRTVEVDGPPVFLRIPPGAKAYDGFSRPRVGRSSSYRTAGVRFARMTTRQLFDALHSETYHRLMERSGNEYRLNIALTEWGARWGKTFVEMIEWISDCGSDNTGSGTGTSRQGVRGCQ
jgi:hypothetical protein